MSFSGRVPALCAAVVSFAFLAGCSQTSGLDDSFSVKSAIARVMPAEPASSGSTRGKRYRASERERECLARAMFFESNRSSRDGLVAVGSVVMNRRDDGRWGNDICSVVGAKRQFAPGVLSRQMNSKALPDVMAAADAVLAGERHGKVPGNVMFFHTAGLKFPYKNMHYTVIAGGNHFYEKRSRMRPMRNLPVETAEPAVMVAEAAPAVSNPLGIFPPRPAAPETQLALAEPQAVATAFAAPSVVPTPTFAARSADQAPESLDVDTVTIAATQRLQPVRTARVDASMMVARSDATDPVTASKRARVTTVAAAPAFARFGGEAPSMTAQMDSGFDTAEPAMAFGASNAQATAVGELIVQQQQLGQ